MSFLNVYFYTYQEKQIAFLVLPVCTFIHVFMGIIFSFCQYINHKSVQLLHTEPLVMASELQWTHAPPAETMADLHYNGDTPYCCHFQWSFSNANSTQTTRRAREWKRHQTRGKPRVIIQDDLHALPAAHIQKQRTRPSTLTSDTDSVAPTCPTPEVQIH